MIQGMKGQVNKLSSWYRIGILLIGIYAGTLSAQRPYVLGSFPRNGAENLLCNTFISVTIFFPSEGKILDPVTLHQHSVKLYPASNPDHVIPSERSYNQEYQTLYLTPLAVLESRADYVFEITPDLVDERGFSFMPYKLHFKTGDCLPEKDSVIIAEPIPDTLAKDTVVETGPPVPFIDLVALKAQYSHDTVTVSWRTYTEFMMAGFHIERSYEGDKFVEVKKMESKGDSDTTQYYKWLDLKQTPGPIYYRLTVTDIYGKEYVSDTIEVYLEEIRFTETTLENSRELPIEFTVKDKTTMAFILRSESNQIVKRKAGAIPAGNQTYIISLDGVEPGRYVAVLQTGKHTIIEQILILE